MLIPSEVATIYRATRLAMARHVLRHRAVPTAMDVAPRVAALPEVARIRGDDGEVLRSVLAAFEVVVTEEITPLRGRRSPSVSAATAWAARERAFGGMLVLK
jgi:hypothetical protein